MKRDGAVLRSLRAFGLAWACGLLLTVVMIVMAVSQHVPVRDPDDTMLRFPLILLGVIAVDVVPRVLHRARLAHAWSGSDLRGRFGEVLRERWPGRHWAFALSGLLAWYLCYATFRNVKSMAPFVNHHVYDDKLADLDHHVWFGHDPATVLHSLFGTGLAAHVFSTAYILWIGLVPVSICVALVWTRNTSAGSWYVTAVAVDWVLGALLYVLVPTWGPIYSASKPDGRFVIPHQFAALPHTFVTSLEKSLWDDRVAVTHHPVASGTLQTIAAFPSLHVGIMTTICLTVQLMGMRRWLRVVSWVFWLVTVCCTIYLGWHFFTDIVAGALVGAFAVWVSAIATGNRVGLRPRLRPAEDPADGAGAQPGEVAASGLRHAPLS